MSISKHWYAVYTRPKAQKKVSELLTKKKIECFSPLSYLIKQGAEKTKQYNDPLLNAYIFVNATEDEQAYIRQIEGVVNFVYWLGRPAIFKENEVNMLRHILNDYFNIKLEKVQVNSDEQMVIFEDNLLAEKSILESYQKPIKVFLPSLGYSLTADVRSPEVKIINLLKSADKPQRAVI